MQTIVEKKVLAGLLQSLAITANQPHVPAEWRAGYLTALQAVGQATDTLPADPGPQPAPVPASYHLARRA